MRYLVYTYKFKIIFTTMLGIGALLVITCSCLYGYSSDVLVSPQLLNSLICGPEELPWDMVLSMLNMGESVTKYRFEALNSQFAIKEKWSGPPTGNLGTLKTAHYSIEIVVAIADSADEAEHVAWKKVSSAATIAPEMSRENAKSFNADRAWYGDNGTGGSIATVSSITFIRRNVVCLVIMSHKDGISSQQVYALVSRLSEKIDAAAEGRPEPSPVLPPSLEDMKVGLEEAWKIKNAVVSNGKNKTTVALKYKNRFAKSMPAVKYSSKDYLTPLSYLSAISMSKQKVKVKGNYADAQLAGKNVRFYKDKKQIEINGRTAKIARAPVFKNGCVFVPLSCMQVVTGQSIVWEKPRGKILVAKLQ